MTMGLLDSILSGITQRGTGNPLLDNVLAMVTNPQHGGLEGLVNSFREKGLGSLVDSWVSTGQNLPISADQIQQALGSDKLGALAGKLGMSSGDLSQKLTELLPGVVDKLTPNGQIPDAGALGQILGALKGRVG
jgi:uncharacterized protein YidB (DUF937 family)